MAPKKFGKYEVLARLATGGAANIFLARQPGAAGFNKLVCLKTLLPERVTDSDFVAMFLDEARLAARLNHPNCVQIYDLGRVRGSYYISMEYIFGETLWNLLATVTKLRTPLPAPHVAAIISNVCDGLNHAHEMKDSNGRAYNLVHRDISPQNIMITFEGQTKVLDFGIAKAETGRAPTVAGIVKGKFSYMSPEQITGAAIDRRSDVYSLGIVLFECLASRRLYRGDSPEEIARLILEHRAPRLKDVVPDIPAALDSICATALARHPSKRYQTAHAMGDALRDYLDSIRYAHSAGAIAKLVEERFRGQIADRRKVFESALNGGYDEAHLLKVLDARAARDLDLFPSESTDGEDFVEQTGELSARSAPDSSRHERDTVQGEEVTGEISPKIMETDDESFVDRSSWGAEEEATHDETNVDDEEVAKVALLIGAEVRASQEKQKPAPAPTMADRPSERRKPQSRAGSAVDETENRRSGRDVVSTVDLERPAIDQPTSIEAQVEDPQARVAKSAGIPDPSEDAKSGDGARRPARSIPPRKPEPAAAKPPSGPRSSGGRPAEARTPAPVWVPKDPTQSEEDTRTKREIDVDDADLSNSGPRSRQASGVAGFEGEADRTVEHAPLPSEGPSAAPEATSIHTSPFEQENSDNSDAQTSRPGEHPPLVVDQAVTKTPPGDPALAAVAVAGPPATVPQIEANTHLVDQRFGPKVVIAAFAIGVALGVGIGLMLGQANARTASANPAQASSEATPTRTE